MGGLKVVCRKSVLSVVLKGGLKVVVRALFRKKLKSYRRTCYILEFLTLVICMQTHKHVLDLWLWKKLT